MISIRYARPEDIDGFSKLIQDDLGRQPICFHFSLEQALADAKGIITSGEGFGLIASDDSKKIGLWIGKLTRIPGATKSAIMDIITVAETPEAWKSLKEMLIILAKLNDCGGILFSVSGRKEQVIERWAMRQGLEFFGYAAYISMQEVQ